VIVPREFAPMPSPPLRHRGLRESTGFPACVFQAWRNLSVRDVHKTKNISTWGRRCRLPLVGPRTPVQGRDGRTAPYPSSTMSSGRLFLNRVARQHCPSPLHRHGQNNMHALPGATKQDISTLQRIGHFYFALTALPNIFRLCLFNCLETHHAV
jgi:hypothetical protein